MTSPFSSDRPLMLGLTGLAKGGLERHVLTLAKALIRDCPLEIVCHFDAWFAQTARKEGLPVTILPLRAGRFAFGAARDLERLARERNFALLHVHDRRIALAARRVARRRRLPLLRTYHGWIQDTLKERLANRLDVAMRLPKEGAVAVSSEIRDTLARLGMAESRIHNIPNSVDISVLHALPAREQTRQAEGFAPNEFLVGMVGRLSAEKNPMLLLKAFARFRRSCPEARIIFVGDGPMRPALEETARRLGLPARFTGFRDDAPALAAALDVFVNPSRTEGTPQALAEAMWLQTPIIATRVGGVPEMAADGVEALLIPSGDEEALVGSLRLLHDDSAQRLRLAAAAHERACREFSAELMAERTLEAYRQMLA